jgi:hypothetical protein
MAVNTSRRICSRRLYFSTKRKMLGCMMAYPALGDLKRNAVYEEIQLR